MSGSASGRAQVSSVDRGFFLQTGSRQDVIFITLSIKELYVRVCYIFSCFIAFAVSKCKSYCFTLIVFVLTRQETIKNNNTEQY